MTAKIVLPRAIRVKFTVYSFLREYAKTLNIQKENKRDSYMYHLSARISKDLQEQSSGYW